jgi:hypothetical protein
MDDQPEPEIKKEKSVERNSLQIFIKDEIINSLTFYLDGTFIADVQVKEFNPQDKKHISDIIKSLNLSEYDTRLRENSKYITEQIDYTFKAEVDFELTNDIFKVNDSDFVHINKIVGKRLFCNCSPILTVGFLYTLFKKQNEMSYVNKLVFRNEINRRISYFKEETDDGLIKYVEMKKIQSQSEFKLIISYLQFISANRSSILESLFEDKVDKTVNSEIKQLRFEDPELFGTYYIDGRPVVYSRLVAHRHERPIVISEDEFEMLKETERTSVASIQNRTNKNLRTYLRCVDPEFKQINFRQLGASCYPRCTKKLRSSVQFNSCIKILDADVNFKVLASNRTIEFSHELIPNARCNVPTAFKTIFPKSVCVCVTTDKAFRFRYDLELFKSGIIPNEILDESCPDVITIKQFCEIYFKKDIVLVNLFKEGFSVEETLFEKVNDDAMIVFKPDCKTDDGINKYYILSTVNNLGKIIPVCKISALMNQIKLYNQTYSLLDRYYKTKPTDLEFVGENGRIFGIVGNDGVFRSIPSFKSTVYKSITDLGKKLTELKLPNINDFYRVDAVSTDGRSIMIENEVFFIDYVKRAPYKRVYIDSQTEFEMLFKQKVMIKKNYTVKQKESFKIRKLLSRALTKGFTTDMSYDELPFKTSDDKEVKIVYLNNNIPSLLQSRINRKDYEYYIRFTNSFRYIQESFNLYCNPNETMSQYETK